MRIYYIAEADGQTCYIRSALGVDAERWGDLWNRVEKWLYAIGGPRDIPCNGTFQAKGIPTQLIDPGLVYNNERGFTTYQASKLFRNGLRIIENADNRRGGIDVINVCLHKADVKDYERVSLNRLLNRINTSVLSNGRYAHLIFDQLGRENVSHAYEGLRKRNPVPSRYEVWEDGAPTKDIPIVRIIGGPSFRSVQDDCLLSMANLIAHALLLQEEVLSPTAVAPALHRVFGILDRTLNRKASRSDPQGIVRR